VYGVTTCNAVSTPISTSSISFASSTSSLQRARREANAAPVPSSTASATRLPIPKRFATAHHLVARVQPPRHGHDRDHEHQLSPTKNASPSTCR
jgi:hypothetical protein